MTKRKKHPEGMTQTELEAWWQKRQGEDLFKLSDHQLAEFWKSVLNDNGVPDDFRSLAYLWRDLKGGGLLRQQFKIDFDNRLPASQGEVSTLLSPLTEPPILETVTYLQTVSGGRFYVVANPEKNKLCFMACGPRFARFEEAKFHAVNAYGVKSTAVILSMCLAEELGPSVTSYCGLAHILSLNGSYIDPKSKQVLKNRKPPAVEVKVELSSTSPITAGIRWYLIATHAEGNSFVVWGRDFNEEDARNMARVNNSTVHGLKRPRLPQRFYILRSNREIAVGATSCHTYVYYSNEHRPCNEQGEVLYPKREKSVRVNLIWPSFWEGQDNRINQD